MSVFTLASFAAHLHAIERDVDHVPQRIIEFAAKAIQAEAKAAIGTGRAGWPPLAASTLEHKGADTPLLETGALRESIEYTIGDHEGWVGTNDPKAAWQEFGTSRGIPPRPFMGSALEARRADIVKAARAMLAAAVAGRGHNAHELRELLHLLRELGHSVKELWDELSDEGESRHR